VRRKLYQVDAFTSSVFSGNPAAVVPLDSWLETDVLQAIAAENNLSETAYFVGGNGQYDLRWFTPAGEVDLCGHATLAAAYVIGRFLEPDAAELTFLSKSGELRVERVADLLRLDFPARPGEPCPATPELSAALGVHPVETVRDRDFMAVLESESVVRALRPNMGLLEALGQCVIVTAEGTDADFVSRFFAPAYGIPEDPVTGSAHCTLVPYWSRRLRKQKLHARQVSARGGELFCREAGDRVHISGRAVLYLEGEIQF